MSTSTGNEAVRNIEGIKGYNALIQDELSICASGALLGYLKSTQKVDLNHIKEIQKYNIENYMIIDSSSRRTLNLQRH